MVGTRYVDLIIDAEVVVTAGAPKAKLQQEILDRLREFFDPRSGGPERSGWPFDRDVTRSEVYSEIHNVPGVAYVTSLGRREYLFSVSLDFIGQLDAEPPLTTLREQFRKEGYVLAKEAYVRIDRPENEWTIVDGNRQYKIRKEEDTLNVYLRAPDLELEVKKFQLVNFLPDASTITIS